MTTRSSCGSIAGTSVDGFGRAPAAATRLNDVRPDEQLVQHQAQRVDVGLLGEQRASVRCSGAM